MYFGTDPQAVLNVLMNVLIILGLFVLCPFAPLIGNSMSISLSLCIFCQSRLTGFSRILGNHFQRFMPGDGGDFRVRTTCQDQLVCGCIAALAVRAATEALTARSMLARIFGLDMPRSVPRTFAAASAAFVRSDMARTSCSATAVMM